MKSFQFGKYSGREEITEPMLFPCLSYWYGGSRRRKGGNMAKGPFCLASFVWK